MNNYIKDIIDQPKSIESVFERYISDKSIDLMKKLTAFDYDRIIFSGMGSSHIACYGASMYLNNNGYISIVKSAGQLLHYERSLITNETLLILVSQSGESAEIVNLLNNINSDPTIVGVTNFPESTLAKKSNYTFLMNVEEEESISTRTYLASLILIDLLAKSFVGKLDKNSRSIFKNAIKNMKKLINNYQSLYDNIKGFVGFPDYICLISRGYSYCSVKAGELFIQELAKYPAIGFEGGEFRHGPMETVEDGFLSVIVAPAGETFELNIKLVHEITEKGGKVLLITNEKITFNNENVLTIKLDKTEELIFPIIDIIPIQLVANTLAERKNLEVGKFRWSSKVQREE